MLYVLSCSTCFVSYVLLCLKCLVPYVLRDPRVLYFTCLVLYILSYLTRLVPNVFSCLTCLMCTGTRRVLCPRCSLDSRVSTFYMLLCSLSLTCFRCFKPNVLLCISCPVAFMPCVSYAFGALAIGVFYSLGLGLSF